MSKKSEILKGLNSSVVKGFLVILLLQRNTQSKNKGCISITCWFHDSWITWRRDVV